jgi:hypothetical protein
VAYRRRIGGVQETSRTRGIASLRLQRTVSRSGKKASKISSGAACEAVAVGEREKTLVLSRHLRRAVQEPKVIWSEMHDGRPLWNQKPRNVEAFGASIELSAVNTSEPRFSGCSITPLALPPRLLDFSFSLTTASAVAAVAAAASAAPFTITMFNSNALVAVY